MLHESSLRTIRRARIKFAHLPCYLGEFATMVADRDRAFGEIRSISVGKGHILAPEGHRAVAEAVHAAAIDAGVAPPEG